MPKVHRGLLVYRSIYVWQKQETGCGIAYIYAQCPHAEKMTSKTYISIAKITALTSFLIGMLISGAYYFTTNGALLFVGYAFVILAGIVNLIVLAGLWSKARTDTTNRGVLWKAARLMLLNIPVLFICIWIATIVLGKGREQAFQ